MTRIDRFSVIRPKDVLSYEEKRRRLALSDGRVFDTTTDWFYFCDEGSETDQLIQERGCITVDNWDTSNIYHLYKYSGARSDGCHFCNMTLSGELGKWYSCMYYVGTQGGKCMSMNNNNDLVQTMMLMKMMSSGDDLDFGKLYLMQQMSSGKTLQISDIMKSKMIKKLGLDADPDTMSLDKLALLQVLNSGQEVDISQLMLMKMMSKMFDEEKEKD